MRRALLAVGMMLTLSGCASINSTMTSWMDHHYSELIASWGPPQQIFDDGQGGRFFVYLLDRTYTVPATSSTTTNFNAMGNYNAVWGTAQSYTTYTPEHVAGYTAFRMFHANASGILYEWRWKGL